MYLCPAMDSWYKMCNVVLSGHLTNSHIVLQDNTLYGQLYFPSLCIYPLGCVPIQISIPMEFLVLSVVSIVYSAVFLSSLFL